MSDDWMVTVDLETTSPVTDEQIDALLNYDGPGTDPSMALPPEDGSNPHQLSFTWTVSGSDPVEVAHAAQKEVDMVLRDVGVEMARQVTLEIVAVDEADRRFAQPTIQPLVGAAEAADLLRVSRQRVHQLSADNPRFPVPVVSVRMGPLWTRASIEAFDRAWSRKPGRPAAVALEATASLQVG